MDWASKNNGRLIQAILALKTDHEARFFLRDLMTEKEINEFSKRLQAAEMLKLKTPYLIIKDETGLSSATIARVAKWLDSKDGGYRMMIDRLNNTDNSPVT